MRLLQMALALSLVASGALQLMCDERKASATNPYANAAMHLSGQRAASTGSASSEASNSNDASDAASEDGQGGGGSDGSEESSGNDDNESSNASKESDGKPSTHRLQDVMNAWSTVKQTLPLKFIGASILLTFIKLYPEYQEFFKDLISVPIEEMEKDKRFNALSVTFMYNLDSILDNLDDEQLVEVLAKQVGHQFSTVGFSEKPFLDMRNLILHMLERYHKRYSNRFPLGIVESASHAVGWLWTLISQGFQTNAYTQKAAVDAQEGLGRRARPHPRTHSRRGLPRRGLPPL